MKNLKFTIAYNGAAYNGYQSQPCGNTVQDTVERVLGGLLNQRTVINGCSRTDAGVHAKEFVFNVKYDEKLSGIDPNGIVRGMNGLLPRDIAVLSCESVPEGFHARFDARGKEYLYLVDTSKIRNVFTEGLALHYPRRIDTVKLKRAAETIVGEHDFSAFCRAEAKEHLKSTVRTVYGIKIEENGNFTEFYVSGSGFLHNMVRIIVGTLLYVNEDKRTLSDVEAAIKTGDRKKAGMTLPPHGLYLNKVFY
ncbi:MAG: tRNA pseudouridine(38-40) synthase TruA [Firmicutes bacterium]|nr:tRNA pseudouridine(38-40) synthase TruA [[Eubacterium] siraeum]MCM1488087.1 tRNA pseudouridine(38-40) synthase TruA [Bacillota bacterium]